MKIILLLILLHVFFSSQQNLVVYVDSINNWWPPAAIAAGIGVPGYASNSSYNVFIMSFWLSTTGPTDVALLWSNAFNYVAAGNPWGNDNSTIQKAWLAAYHAQGIKVLVSAFGGTDFPTTGGVDPIQCGMDLANFVKANNFDGVDLDWEDNGAMEAGTGEAWLINITTVLRQQLPRSEGYIITHAPQAPYFMGTSKYPNGGYLTIDKAVGDLIDWYNVQFYNQDTSGYLDYTTLFQQTDGWATGTSVFEMNASGIPLSRIVIGKPITVADEENTGYISVDTFASALQTAVSQTAWKTGVMGWEYPQDLNGTWINALAAAMGYTPTGAYTVTRSTTSSTSSSTGSTTSSTSSSTGSTTSSASSSGVSSATSGGSGKTSAGLNSSLQLVVSSFILIIATFAL